MILIRSSWLRKCRRHVMDAIDLDYTHLGQADQPEHADLARAARELRSALVTIGGQAPGLDEPITAVQHSFGMDGKTLFVHIELPDGISRVYSFSPGSPVGISDDSD